MEVETIRCGSETLRIDILKMTEATNHGRSVHLHLFRKYFDACEGFQGSGRFLQLFFWGAYFSPVGCLIELLTPKQEVSPSRVLDTLHHPTERSNANLFDSRSSEISRMASEQKQLHEKNCQSFFLQ